MNHLAPPSAVVRAAQPTPPESHRCIERGGDVVIATRSRHFAGLDGVQHKGRRIPGPERETCADVAAVDDLQRAACGQIQRERRSAEVRAALGEPDLMTHPGVIEAGRDIGDETHLASHRQNPADHAVATTLPIDVRRHEVLHLGDSVRHEEARDEHIGVGQVQLPGTPALAMRRDSERAAAVGVEDGGKDAR